MHIQSMAIELLPAGVGGRKLLQVQQQVGLAVQQLPTAAPAAASSHVAYSSNASPGHMSLSADTLTAYCHIACVRQRLSMQCSS